MSDILRIKLNDSERFLCAVLSHREHLDCQTIIKLYKKVGDEDLFSVCKHNKIESIATDALGVCLGLDQLPEHWLESYAVVDRRISSYMKELDRVAKLLSNLNIPLVALKNSGITRGLYPYYGACPMGDMDVLVKKEDYSDAKRLLIDDGYIFGNRNFMEKAFYKKLSGGEPLWFELLVRSVDGRWISPDQEPGTDELIESSVAINGSDVRILSPEHNLLQVCLHTAKHSFVRAPGFRLHTDVDRIVHETDLDWILFKEMVSDLQVKTAAFFSLALASDLLGTPIPEHVMIQIKPNRWKVWIMSKWLQKVGLFDPDGVKWGAIGYIFFVSMLYDSVGVWLKGIIPEKKWMFEHYGTESSFKLLFLYPYRIYDLLWRRVLKKG